MRIGLSTLCVDPKRKTGLASMFSAFVREAVRLYDDVEFVVFSGCSQPVVSRHDRVRIVNGFANASRPVTRLYQEYLEVGAVAARNECDVLLTNALTPLRCAIPVAMHLLSLHHASEANKIGRLRSLYRNRATRHGLRAASLIITNSRFACEQILALDKSVSRKLLCSYEGIDHAQFHARGSAAEREMLRRRFGIDGPYYLWCSNFYPYKNAEGLMTAWCGLPEPIRREAPLVMVGGDHWGSSKHRALEIARRRGALEDVKMLGWVDDAAVPILFRHASVFVHPSREETFGRSVLEGMASGIPCVVQDIPVMREVTNGSALLINYDDQDAATDALLGALGDTALRSRLVASGIERAAEFSFERLGAERIEALRSLLGLGPGAHRAKYRPVYASC
jgi:glycosyltransferase involved in cell wall biosynthesis